MVPPNTRFGIQPGIIVACQPTAHIMQGAGMMSVRMWRRQAVASGGSWGLFDVFLNRDGEVGRARWTRVVITSGGPVFPCYHVQ